MVIILGCIFCQSLLKGSSFPVDILHGTLESQVQPLMSLITSYIAAVTRISLLFHPFKKNRGGKKSHFLLDLDIWMLNFASIRETHFLLLIYPAFLAGCCHPEQSSTRSLANKRKANKR